jgi:ATP-grasp domain-containing protein
MAQARMTAPAPAAARVRVIAPAALGATAVAALRLRGIAAELATDAGDPRTSRDGATADADELARDAHRTRRDRATADAEDAHARRDGATRRGFDESDRHEGDAALRVRASLDPRTLAVGDDVIAWALAEPPSPALAIELATVCERAAAAGRPVCLFAPTTAGSGHTAIERTAALAYLRAHGAALAHDVDAWLESVVMLVRFGMPAGPMTAVVAPGTWLEAQARALVDEVAGERALVIDPEDRTDVVLYDPTSGAPPRTTPGLHVPVVARGELAGETIALFGVRAAVGAIDVLGRAALRIAAGIGAAPRAANAELQIDEALLERQRARLDDLARANAQRIGDHDVKTLLRAYRVSHTRQAVAQTASEAVKKARSVGFPVEIKPWGPDVPTESAGCPVERDVSSDALVRQAYHAVLGGEREGAVIIRETPPRGREIAVTFVELPAIGWTAVLDAPGAPRSAAAPAPLRAIDAAALAAHVVASRAGDPEPDRVGLADLLRRASHLVVDLEQRIARLELARVVVGGRGARTLVIDAVAQPR